MNKYTLIIFDLDGTIADRDTGELLDNVEAWFDVNKGNFEFAIATNQGGVGLRHWMESGGFGEPDKFPTEEQVRERAVSVVKRLGAFVPIYYCFAYQSKKSGKWAPAPDGCEDDPEWDRNCRKPAPGMIFQAIRERVSTRTKTLFVGDSDEDKQAAADAGVDFMDAERFFGRDLPF